MPPMEPGRLKRKFDGKFVFWDGWCDTQEVLPHDKPEELRRCVRRSIELFAARPDGSVFILLHKIQQNVTV